MVVDNTVLLKIETWL